MNIKALRQRKADLVATMKATQAKLGATDITEEQRSALRAEFKSLEASYDANEDDLAAAVSGWLHVRRA